MAKPEIKIRMTSPRSGEVMVDGVKLDNVVAVGFEVDVRPGSETPACVEIVQRLYPSSLEISGGEMGVTTLGNSGVRQYTQAR